MYVPPLLWPEGLRPHIGPWEQQLSRLVTGTPVSTAWISANRAIYLPFHVIVPTTVMRLWLAVGATGGTNSVDMGIYDAAFARLVSGGGVTVGTANQVQYINTTDVTLPPGAYYLGIAMNGTTATVLAGGGTEIARARIFGALQQDTAYVLPATATMVACTAQFVPVCGLATTASP